MSNITGDIFLKRLANSRRNTELFLEEKITEREQRAIETLINNSLAEEGVFHCLNERFVSNKLEISFFRQGSSERFRQ